MSHANAEPLFELPAPEGYEVMVDRLRGRVWINGPDGGAVGRFNLTSGVDIHRTTSQQLEGQGQCLHCTHGRPGPEEWALFIGKAQELWGITIPEDVLDSSQISYHEDGPSGP